MVGKTRQCFFLSFRSSCLVSSSISEVWLVLRICPIDQFCSPLAILLCSWVFTALVYWGLVSLPCALSLGQSQRTVSQLSTVSLLCWFADCFSILECCLTLDAAYWLSRWALWTTISGSSLSPAHCWPFCLSSLCLLKVCGKISSLLLSLSLVCSEHPAPSASCSFSVPCLLFSFCSCFFFFFFAGRESVCPGGFAGFSQG
jgi:hypothetical protein